MAHGRDFHPRSQRRRTRWAGGPSVHVETQTASADILSNGVNLGSGETLARIRGRFEIIMDGATAAQDGVAGAFGIGIVSGDAFAAGAASVPKPSTDPDWSWIYHRHIILHALTTSSAIRESFDIDSKAMRKTKNNEVLFGMVSLVEDGSITVDYEFNTRILIMVS